MDELSGEAGADDASGAQVIARLWERNYDPTTSAIIGRLPLTPRWRCLDLGAGTGSMSAWLARRVPDGSVLAVDVDVTQFDAPAEPNLTVKQLDLTVEDFPEGSFDLVLARAVFSQLPDPDAALARAARWLAPGGWLLVEDFYFMPADDAVTEAGKAVVRGYVQAFDAAGVHARWGRRIPALLARAGLTSLDRAVRPLGPGQGDTENALMRARLRYQGQPLVDGGLVGAEDLAEFVATLDQPHAQDVTTLQVSTWGRRPVG